MTVPVIEDVKEAPGCIKFKCPGCGHVHMMGIAENGGNALVWRFNGDYVRPTFTPSLLVTWPLPSNKGRCHSYITDGSIRFLSDCTHDLKGKTVALLPIYNQ